MTMLVQIKTSSVIDAPIDKVWTKIRDFNGLPDWHPYVVDSQIENGDSSATIGCIRCFHRENGSAFREKLRGLDDQDYCCTYALLEPAQPLVNYIAKLQLFPITDGDRTYITWQAQFECLPEEEEELRQVIEDVFGAGFDALKEMSF